MRKHLLTLFLACAIPFQAKAAIDCVQEGLYRYTGNRLVITNCSQVAGKINTIGEFKRKHPEMTSIDFENDNLTDENIEDIKNSLLPILHLRLSHNAITEMGVINLVAGEYNNIQDLSLDGNPVKDTAAYVLALKRTLWFLDLSRTQITNQACEYLAASSSLSNLALENNHLDATCAAYLSSYQGRTLWLNDNLIGDKGAAALAANKSIESLYVERAGLTDVGVKALTGNPSFISLSLSGNQLTDAGAFDLAKLRNLQMLTVDDTAITDAGIDAITKLPKLGLLSLNNTKITDRGAIMISRNVDKYNEGKLMLWVENNAGLTKAGMAILENNPKIMVVG